jgi:DNA-binding SARP family transcriptional activator
MEEGGTDVALLLRVLGPTTLERSGSTIAIGGPRQRAVLARLAHAEGRLVVVERLVEDLWGVERRRRS